MNHKLTAVAGITTILMLSACSDKNAETTAETQGQTQAVEVVDESQVEQTDVVADIERNEVVAGDTDAYEILKDEVDGENKRTVEVELPARLSEIDLIKVSKNITAQKPDAKNTTMIYRITGTDHNQEFWAETTSSIGGASHHAIILGATPEQYEAILSTPLPEGEVIGSWFTNMGNEARVTLYKKDGLVYIQNVNVAANQPYKNEPEVVILQIEMTEIDRGTKLKPVGEGLEETKAYYLINKNGELEAWELQSYVGKEGSGIYHTAPKLEL